MNDRNSVFPVGIVHPNWWFVFSLYLLLSATALVNYRNFRFERLNFFTLIWIGTGLVVVHCVLNIKTYRQYFEFGNWRLIPRSLYEDMTHYLPYLLLAALYDNIPLFHHTAGIGFIEIDRYLMKADAGMFGAQPTILLQNYINPWAVDFFMIMYSLFVLPYLLLIYLFQKKESALFSKLILSQIIASMVALICFIYLPARGPRFVFDRANSSMYENAPHFTSRLKGIPIQALNRTTGYESLFDLQHDAWNRLERVKTDCMPSMHAALYLICIFFVIRYRKIMKWRRLAAGFWIVSGAFMLFSLVYLRYHWVMDIIAGIFVALFSFFAAELIIDRWLRFQKSHLPLTNGPLALQADTVRDSE
jgi:membrane-associated phospholipid phosphatase